MESTKQIAVIAVTPTLNGSLLVIADSGVLCCAGSGDNSICIFEEQASISADVDPQQKPSFHASVRQRDAHPTDVNCVKWHPRDPTLLASAGDDGCIKLWRYHKDSDAEAAAGPSSMQHNGV